jgi:uroporphyrinogen-III synthase
MGLPRVLVTRPQPQADDWVVQLQALGLSAAALPLLQTSAAGDPARLQAALDQLPGCTLVMFVSPNAVAHWRAAAPAGWQWPPGVLAGATGPGTQAALQAAGVPVSAIVAPPADAERFDSEALWAVLQGLRSWAGARVQVVRGVGGRDWLADTMRQAGAQVYFVEAYRRTAPVPGPTGQQRLVAALADPARHVWLFSSSEAVGHLATLAPGADWSRAWALATHPRIAEAARALGCGRVDPVAPTPEAVAQALRRSAGAGG